MRALTVLANRLSSTMLRDDANLCRHRTGLVGSIAVGLPQPAVIRSPLWRRCCSQRFVLMKQNRMGVVADRRDHLDLKVNLLTEKRATQIIQMLDRLAHGWTSISTMTD